MKIPASIRAAFESQLPLNLELQKRVDAILRNRKDPHWHYESRIKDAESFALKIESGRVPKPEALEDFFACTLVVRSSAEISAAEQLLREQFQFVARRPKQDDETFKHSNSFPFDDLRLFLRWRDSDSQPPSGLTGIKFECQVKTFLQHAWTIATHDLIYKTEEPHWGKQRIAFQIKAMLEHAEVSIQEADKLSLGSALSKSDKETRSLSDTIATIRQVWPASDLPKDLRRLGENVEALCGAVRITVTQLKQALDAETALGRGALTRNLSPYGVAVDALLRQHTDLFLAAVTRETRPDARKILVPAEVELPAKTDPNTWASALRLPA